ncbi:MAG: PAS domain-containing protein [Acidobacteria bacterium]|nr:PAS domain-containing protein [Acidobacteriota bacterium]
MSQILRLGEWITRSRWRSYLFFFLLAVPPAVLLPWSAGRILSQENESRALRASTQIAELTAILVEEHFQNGAAFLESYANRSALQQAWEKRDLEAVAKHLDQAHLMHPDFRSMGVLDLNGVMRVIQPFNPALLNVDLSGGSLYRGISQSWSSPYVSEVFLTAGEPRRSIGIAVVIRDQQEKPLGILQGLYEVGTVSRWLKQVEEGGTRQILVVDQDGHFLAGSEFESQQKLVDFGNYEPAQQAREGREGSGIFYRNEREIFAAYAPIASYGWGVVVEQPAESVRHLVNAAQNQLWFFGALFVVFALAGGGLLASLYRQLDASNHFFALSLDLLCIAGFDGYFKRLNPAWERAVGFSTEELLAKPYLELVHPEDREATISKAKQLTKGRAVISFENRYRCKDGSYKWLSWRATSSIQQGAIFAVATDITEQKRYQEEIELKNRELEMRNLEVVRANQMKSQFLASMSHELRTPLNAILGFSELLVEQGAGSLSEKQVRYLRHIRAGGEHLLQLINDILDLSKIEAGRMEVHPEDFSVAETMPEVLSIVRPQAMVKKIVVENLVPADITVHADRVRFKQILYNLLSNAVKFTPEGGKVSIGACRADDFAQLNVADTGIGVPAEEHSSIFEEFHQVGTTTKGVREGTGLGLAITKRLVERQGGKIWLKSAPGAGSRFYFTLPLGGEIRKAPAAPEKAASRRR